jgi:hypothetical protein
LTYSKAVAIQRDLKNRIGEVNSNIDAENARRFGSDLDPMVFAVDFTVGYLTRPRERLGDP